MDNKWRRQIKPSTLKWTYKNSHFHICKHWWVQLGWVLRRWKGQCPQCADGTKACREKRNQIKTVHRDRSTQGKKTMIIDSVQLNVRKIPHALFQHFFHKFGFGHFLICSETVRPVGTKKKKDQLTWWAVRVIKAHRGGLHTHQSSQLHRNWKLLRWWENQLISLQTNRLRWSFSLSDGNDISAVWLNHLSMQVVFMVSSLMYNISVAWAN